MTIDLGGLVGNQGGIRSAALLGFDLKRDSMIATATAVGLGVDAARMPVYFALYRHDMADLTGPIVVATIAVLAGTVAGRHILSRLRSTGSGVSLPACWRGWAPS